MSENYPEGVTGDDVDIAYENRIWDEMNTPAARLLRAADLLEKAAEEATEGQWAYELLPARWDGDRDAHWVRCEHTDADGGTTSSVIMDAVWGEGDARYIAMMHPAIGLAISDAMKYEAHRSPFILPNPHLSSLADLVLAGEQEQG